MEFDGISISSQGRLFERPGSDIKKTGYLKKLKTNKKKFFVLRSTSSSGPARLEYYDSKKKFEGNQQAKRSIHLHTCFNINKKNDSRQGKYGIVLYTNEECFTVLAETEEDQESWLSIMLEFQNEYLPDGDMHKEHYEHVWQVTLQPRGLGQGKGSKGQYRLCLNNTTVSLVKTNASVPQYTIQLVTIRTVAHNECSFRLEVGKVASTGEGEFWFTVEDANIAKDMHSTLLHYMNTVKDPSLRKEQQAQGIRKRAESHSSMSPGRRRPSKPEQRPASYYPPPSPAWPSMDAASPNSPNYPPEHPFGPHRPRSDTAESRASRTSSHYEEPNTDIMIPYNGDQMDKEKVFSVVPPDMSPPSSPGCLDEMMNTYLEMDMDKSRQAGNMATTPPANPPSSYFNMNLPATHSHGHHHKELNPVIPEGTTGYMSMVPHHGPPAPHMSAPIPIHSHSYSDPHHSTPLPTVREGGSNEGYLPMDPSSSPASISGILRPDPAKCMLSDDATGLPPRTYSLGSKPVTKKYPGYIEMGPRKGGLGNDMSRAISAPHIIHNNKGRSQRDHTTESPTPSASPLSMSVKSDDSDSFMEYMPMRPRTASDSFNYRPRTSSFGKLKQTCRPRSSSHGQGTRPFTKFSKLNVEQGKLSHDKASWDSSLHGSFDSLGVSSESLRRMSQEMRQPSGSNASDYAEMRGTPSPQLKNVKSDPDGYVSMHLGPSGRKSSPHRTRTDSSGSMKRPDIKSSSSERLHQQSHLHPIEDYTEMTPTNAGGGSNSGDSYMNMDFPSRNSFSSDSRSLGSQSSSSIQSAPRNTDSMYMNMELDNKKKRDDGGRSVSMENVDTYVIYDPSHSGNKPRTGSLGSKDKKALSRPGSARKSSSASMSSSGTSSNPGNHYPQPSVSTSTRAGGSNDSIRKASRQSSMEKYGSLGKDFRKKSGSTGSRPTSAKGSLRDMGHGLGKDHHLTASSIMPVRRSPSTKVPIEEPADEYIEFAPPASKGDTEYHHSHSNFFQPGMTQSSTAGSNSARNIPFSSSGSFSSSRSSNPTPSPGEDESYTLYSPGPQGSSKSVHFHQQQHLHHLPHHHPQSRVSHSPSSSSSHTKQIAAKDIPEYVGFEPGIIPSSSSFSSHSSLTSAKQVEAKDAPEYVGFEPGVLSTSSSTSSSSSNQTKQTPSSMKAAAEYIGFEPGTKQVVAKDIPEYVGFQPGTAFQQSASQPAVKPISPSSAVSYIQSQASNSQGSKSKPKQQSGFKQQHRSLDTGTKLSKPDTYCESTSPRMPTSSSLTFEPPPQTPPTSSLLTKNQTASLSSTSSSSTTSSGGVPGTKVNPIKEDDNEYMSYLPATTNTSTKPSQTCKENTVPVVGKGVGDRPGYVTQKFAPLSIDVEGDKRQAYSQSRTENNGGSQQPKPLQLKQQPQRGQHQKQQQKQQKGQSEHPSPGYHRQMSAPASTGKPSPILSDSQLQPPSPQPNSPLPSFDNSNNSRHKHLSGSSVSESPSPSPTTTTTSRHKHWSGSSNTSQKSRRVSSDSEKSLRKGTKSDSNSSLNSSSGSKSKRRIPSGDKSPGGSAEKSPLSPSRGSGEFFCGEASPVTGKALEAKIVPVESKIRHSLGDMTGVVGVVNKEGSSHQGLSRPGSTPCMQNLDPLQDQGSRSAGDYPCPHPRSSTLHMSAGPRSRHSLSDLGAYQQMNFASSGLSSLTSEVNTKPPGNNNNIGGSNSGSVESCGSNPSELGAKPLNYVKLDLSCPEGQGDAEGKSPRVKSRNSSDADEKQPPLSYAEIDFVKSQNLNKALALGSSGDNSSSKS